MKNRNKFFVCLKELNLVSKHKNSPHRNTPNSKILNFQSSPNPSNTSRYNSIDQILSTEDLISYQKTNKLTLKETSVVQECAAIEELSSDSNPAIVLANEPNTSKALNCEKRITMPKATFTNFSPSSDNINSNLDSLKLLKMHRQKINFQTFNSQLQAVKKNSYYSKGSIDETEKS